MTPQNVSVSQKKLHKRTTKTKEELFPELVTMAFNKVWNELNGGEENQTK
ncbi:hypothetical protein LCGC14_2535640 [marine sediment metagenome]|uniref:Uncharacterized protein n=1 Tax=marine sediment metagenome TaxID=412755 RepID=A0A0F9AS87_9ZZZZ